MEGCTVPRNRVIYEQPANELIRVCLRLEHLFQQADDYLRHDAAFHSKDLIRIIIEMQNVLDRPDLKSKFTQEFHRFMKVFSALENSPNISKHTLEKTLRELSGSLQYFVDTKGKLVQRLYENPFLANIRTQFTTAGGDSAMDIPSFYYWLQQPSETRLKAVHDWLASFDQIKAAVTLTLNIARHSSEPRSIQAEEGYYHDVIGVHPPCQMIRISLDTSQKLFPKVSVGKHRMNIRFLVPQDDGRPTQTTATIPFILTICNI